MPNFWECAKVPACRHVTGLQPRVVIEVQFPPLMSFQVEQSDSVVPYKPGQAAVSDWSAEIHELFSSHIDLRAEHGTLQVTDSSGSCVSCHVLADSALVLTGAVVL